MRYSNHDVLESREPGKIAAVEWHAVVEAIEKNIVNIGTKTGVTTAGTWDRQRLNVESSGSLDTEMTVDAAERRT